MTPELKTDKSSWSFLTSFGEYSSLLIPSSPSELLDGLIADFDQLIEVYENGEVNDLLMFGSAHRALGFRLAICPALREMIENGITEREKAILPALAPFGITSREIRSHYALTRDWILNIPAEFEGKEGDYILDKLETLRDFFASL